MIGPHMHKRRYLLGLLLPALLVLTGTSWKSLEAPHVGLEEEFPLPDSMPKEGDLKLVHVITGDIRPKSVVHSGKGRFFAQNMVYRHHVTVYDRNFTLIKTISDRVRLSDYLELGYTGSHQGGPVEACFTEGGDYAYVSNYQMHGQGFDSPGGDLCDPDAQYDHSYVYRIDGKNLTIDEVIAVGSVPKYLAATPDGKLVLVANWCSGDVSVIDTELGKEIQRIYLGKYPRGIAIDSKSRYAYVALMGEDRLAAISLSNSDFPVSWIEGLERTPRHLCIDPTDRFLYISLSRPGKVLKYDLVKEEVVGSLKTGREVRSMVLTPEGEFLYVTNYADNTLSKVATAELQLVQTIETRDKPIGVTFDPQTRQVWVACYSGAIMVFQDQRYLPPQPVVRLEEAGPLPPEMPTQPSVAQVPGTPNAHPVPYYYIKRKTDESVATVQGPVRTRAVAPAPIREAPRPESTATQDNHFFIVVGSFQSKARANVRVDQLRKQGYDPVIRADGKGRFRVCSHALPGRTEAMIRLREVKAALTPEAWLLAD